jgi:hypothetical protein
MNAPLTDGELLDLLADALDPAPIHPTPAEHEQLRRALATVSAAGEHQQAPRKVNSLRRLPHPVAAVAVVVALTTGGAAAAVETNTLPGPLRNIAVAVGLPVTSPALEQVDSDLAALRAALNLGDASAIRADAATLSHDLDTLSPDDRVTVDGGANLLLTQADGWLSAHPSDSGPAKSGGSRQGTDDHVGGGDGRAVTGGDSGGGDTNGRGGDGSETQEPSTNTSSGGDDSSGGTSGSGPGPGNTSGEGSQDGDGSSASGTTPVTGQTPVTDGGGGSGGGQGDGGSSGTDGGSSSSDGGPSSMSGGPGSTLSGSGSTSPAPSSSADDGRGGG